MSDRYEFEMDEWDMDRPENVVYVVGLGPGDVSYLTQEAQSALEHADAICGYKLYIDLIEPEFPCEEYYATGMTQEIDRCRWALEKARTGKRVALVCSGDAGVYGMASPLLELAEDYPDVAVEVVPGLTAALSGGAVLGAPLAHDFCVISLSDRLTPWEVIEKRLACAAQGDFCVALYNPSSKGRPDYLQKAVRILRANGKGPETVCGLVRNIGREGQSARGYVHHRVHRQREHPRPFGPDGHTPGVSQMKAVVFSGTTEGRRFSKKLAALGAEVTVCVATPLGAEEQGEMAGITVHAGRLGPDAMAALLTGADLCVDATHPYAVDVTRNIRAAAAQAGVEYRRLLRARSPLPEDCVVFGTAAQAAEYLAGTKENILLATGAKELAAFAPLDPARLYPRVLPTPEGIAACEAAGIPHRNIIAMQGPFSCQLNKALIEQFHIRYLVTKDGGAAGGFAEKVQAAAETGVQLVVLRRPEEVGETEAGLFTHCQEILKWSH